MLLRKTVLRRFHVNIIRVPPGKSDQTPRNYYTVLCSNNEHYVSNSFPPTTGKSSLPEILWLVKIVY